MSTWQVDYVPGSWVVVSGSRAAVAMQPPAADHVIAIERALSELRDVADLPTLTRRLLGWDPALMVDLLLVSDDDGKVTAVVRGGLKVHDAETGAIVANGDGGSVWQYPTKDSNQLRIDFGPASSGAKWSELIPGTVRAAVLGVNAGRQPVTAPWPTEDPIPRSSRTQSASAEDATMVMPAVTNDMLHIEPATPAPASKATKETTKPLVTEPTVATQTKAATKVRTPQVRALLAFSDGRVLPLAGSVVVGRSPQVAAGERVVPVKVSSPNHDVSRTHVRIDPQGDGWLISDLNSTNGTLVRRPGESSVIATEGAPVLAGVGSLIALGDNVVIRIDAADID